MTKPGRKWVDAVEYAKASIGMDLRRLREVAGLTKAEAARRAGIRPGALSRLEGGRGRAAAPVVGRVLRAVKNRRTFRAGGAAEILSVEVLGDYRVHLVFRDGKCRAVDLAPHLFGPMFAPLRRPSAFRRARVGEGGCLEWPNGADICPDVLYYHAGMPPWARRRPGRRGARTGAKIRKRLDRIVSGGQTGADRGGLDAAIQLGIAHGGWCPKGRRAEDGSVPASYRLSETRSASYRERTRRNVEEADGTALFTFGRPGGGSALTLELARRLGKPRLHLDLKAVVPRAASSKLDAWLASEKVRVLNVAGAREGDTPGMERAVRGIVVDCLRGDAAGPPRRPPATMREARATLRRARRDARGRGRGLRARLAAKKVWTAASIAAEAMAGPVRNAFQVFRAFGRAWGAAGRRVAEDVEITLLRGCFYGNAVACDGEYVEARAARLGRIFRRPVRDRAIRLRLAKER